MFQNQQGIESIRYYCVTTLFFGVLQVQLQYTCIHNRKGRLPGDTEWNLHAEENSVCGYKKAGQRHRCPTDFFTICMYFLLPDEIRIGKSGNTIVGGVHPNVSCRYPVHMVNGKIIGRAGNRMNFC